MEKEFNNQTNLIKDVNKGLIKAALHRLKAATKIDLSNETKISPAALAVLLNELQEEKEVIQKGIAESSVGRRATIYALNSQIANIAAIIAYAEYIEYMITDLDGQIIDRRSIEVSKNISYVDNLFALIEKLMKKYEKIKAVAVGVPGAVNLQGKIFAIPQIPELEDCNLKEKIQEKFQILVTVKNDMNVIALGYYRKGVAYTLDDMVYIHIGAGFGAGIIIDGKIHSGFTSFAGEVAFIQLKDKRTTEEIILNKKRKREQSIILSKVINNIICIINPSILVLGGDMVTEQLPEEIKNNCLKVLSPGMLPIIRTIDDEEKFYFDGLVEIAIDSYCLESITLQ